MREAGSGGVKGKEGNRRGGFTTPGVEKVKLKRVKSKEEGRERKQREAVLIKVLNNLIFPVLVSPYQRDWKSARRERFMAGIGLQGGGERNNPCAITMDGSTNTGCRLGKKT